MICDGSCPASSKPCLAEDQDRRRVGADRHEGAVAERDLAGVAGEDVETEERDEVDRDVRELPEAELAREPRQQRDQRRPPRASTRPCRANVGSQRRIRLASPRRGRRGRSAGTTSTSSRMASAVGSRRSCPTKSTYAPSRLITTPSSEAADDGADRAVDAAEHRRRERVDQDDEHHVRVEEDRRRGHHPGDRAERRGEAPAEREHPADAHAHQPARAGIERDRAHREAERREAEEEPEHGDRAEAHAERADVLERDRDAADDRRSGWGTGCRTP